MKKIFLFILILFSISLSAGEIVIINGPERKTCGFLAVDRGVTYLYTSQSAIFGMKLIGINYSFNAVTLKGKKVTTSGSPEVCAEYDVVRIVVMEDFPDAFKLGTVKELDEEITLFPDALEKSETSETDIVTGIGLYSFTFENPLEENAPGSPVLNQDGEVVGVLSAWPNKIVKGNPPPPPPPPPKKGKSKGKKKPPPKKPAEKKDKDGKPVDEKKEPEIVYDKPGEFFKSVVVKRPLVAKVFPNMDFVSIQDADFLTAADAIDEAYRLQKEFMPLLNWWYGNPYRLVGQGIEFPNDLKKFVKYNNERARRMDVHLKKMKSDPVKNENLLKGVRDNCVHRAKLFIAFPQSQKVKLEAKWKTQFLSNQAANAAENWDFILPVIKARKRSMEYRLPYKF